MGTVMKFADIFRSSFLNTAGTQLTIADIAITLALTFAGSLFIFFVYRRTYQGILYTRSFNVALIALALVTSLVIMAISSNIVLSLGMVGALSIVRFRTAIKDPMDIVFMFWSIALGILNGAGFFLLAGAGTVFVGIILFFFARRRSLEKPYLLVATCSESAAEMQIYEIVKASTRRHQLRSKTVSPESTEITFEVRVRDGDADFVNRIAALKGVLTAILISYNGDYAT